MNKVLKKHYLLAQKLASKSDHHTYKLGCVIFRNNNVIGVGFNKIKTHPKSPHKWKMIHAEFDALIGVQASDLRGSSVIVYRESKAGNIGLAKPCKSCEGLLFQVGIEKVYYTTDNGISCYEF